MELDADGFAKQPGCITAVPMEWLRKGKRGKPITEQAKSSNRTKSIVRVRVEHVFGAQTNDMGGTLVRTIGLVRAKAKIGLKNLADNMRRLCQLRRINPNPA
jgi:IS5 family transposase